MLKNIFTIAKNTFKETVRDKILLSAFFVIIAIILFSLFIASISLEQGTRVIVNFGVTAIYALQMFVAIFIGSMLIYKEIERRTFFLLLPKPISRTEVVVGKCLGLTATTSIVTLFSTLALCVVLFLNNGTEYITPILISVFLSTFEAILLILISLFFSGIMSPLMASVTTIAFFFLGHAGALFKTVFMTTDSTFVELVTRGSYYLLPNLEKFNIRNDIVYGTLPSSSLFLIAILYAISYTTLLLIVTHIVFKKKDF
jgi:ABC-type transport system involved in multi-copper enzyme maturation permease subunit